MTPEYGYDRYDPFLIKSVQNLGDSNADFSKPPDFSKLTVSPDLFSYYLMKKYY